MGARPEPVPQVVQTPASSVSALRGEVDHIEHAIKSIRCERQLQEAQAKQVAAEPSNHWMFPRCLCGMLGHVSEWMELGGSEMDVKLQAASCKCACRLLILLSDSYFRLGRAYKEDGQFNRALKAVEFATLTRNSPIYYCWRSSREEKLRKLKDLRDPKAPEFAWGMRRLPPPPNEAFFPKGASFYRQACILEGDAYFEAQRTFDDSHVVIPHQEGEELTMSQEVQKELKRVVRSCRGCCFFSSRKTFPLPKIVENKWENNLSAAELLYFNALPFSDCVKLALKYSEYIEVEDTEDEDTEDEDTKVEDSDEDTEVEDTKVEDSEFTKIAYRKLGFVWYEWGRRLAELGWHAKDETDEYSDEDTEVEDTKVEDSDEDTEVEDTKVEDSEFTKIAYRKLGFVWYEWGRRLAELGWHAKDETDEYFRRAIDAFHKGKYLPNFELALCSRIEYHRKLANFRETHQGPEGRMEEARGKYEKALDLCSEARNRLKEWGDGQCKKVDTEEAHTYLKLGMFLMRVGKQAELNTNGQITAEQAIHMAWNLSNNLLDCVTHSQYQLDCIQRERRLFESDVKSDVTVDTEEADTYLKLGIMLMREDKFYYDNQEPNRKGWISAEEAIHEAIDLFKKLDCKQGVAYSQYRLGCVLRDRLLFEFGKSDVTRLGKELTRIWRRASKYYVDVGDFDMFLRIRMEHADQQLAMQEGLDKVLEQLLEVCRMMTFNGSSVSEEFIQKLLELLMTMRTAAKSQHDMRTAAKSQHDIVSSSSPSRANRANYYEFISRMNKHALELKFKEGGKDYSPLHDMWINYHKVLK